MAYSYCDVPTYEMLTGTSVPTAQRPQVQALLDLTSDLIGLYLGEPAATDIPDTYGNVLEAICANRVYRLQTIPIGIQSESVGSASVTYAGSQAGGTGLLDFEKSVLDQLAGRVSDGRGIKAVSFAGRV